MTCTDVDAFIDKMCKKLSKDIIEYIVKRHIFLPNNKLVIKRQKVAKYLMHLQLLFISNVIHIDDRYCIYIHNNSIVIYNIQQQSSHSLNTSNYQDMQNAIFYIIYSLE
jgi:hypothetical protein